MLFVFFSVELVRGEGGFAEEAAGAERDKTLVADDEMIVETDAHHSARLHEQPCEAIVALRGCGIATGMVVREDQAMRLVLDCGIKDLARMHQNLGECSY